jgi:hypothetical protein
MERLRPGASAMIISFEHNYIFIKTTKVAGTSIEIALSRFCGPRDIITPIYPRNEIHRKPPARWPQNFSDDPALERQYAETAARGDLVALWTLFRQLEQRSIYFNHMRAAQIRRQIGEEFWQQAFKFTVERNPYERVVSNAFWRIRDRNPRARPDASEVAAAIEQSITGAGRSTDYYMIDGVVAVDRILRYENLKQELASIAGHIGGDISESLPRAKSGARRPDQTAANLLTADQKRRIAEHHAEAFALLGYPTEL